MTATGTRPAPTPLERFAAGLLSLLLMLAGLALVLVGGVFATVGVLGALRPEDGGHLVAGVLFALLGVAVAGVGVLLAFRTRPRLVARLTGGQPRSGGAGSGGFFGGGSSTGDSGCGGSDGGGGGGGDGGSC